MLFKYKGYGFQGLDIEKPGCVVIVEKFPMLEKDVFNMLLKGMIVENACN